MSKGGKAMENLKLWVSSAPHIRSNTTIDDIMLDVILALMPAAFAGVYCFGRRALVMMLVSVLACVAFEFIYERINKRKITVGDMSAVVTGMLTAMIIPVSVPYYMVVIGAFFAIIITKQLFGGIGQNFMNPALAARAFLLASFPVQMTTFPTDRMNLTTKLTDVITGATPLSKEYTKTAPTLTELFWGRTSDGVPIGGCIGETCAAAIIIGLVYLLVRRVISIRIPAAYVLTVAIIFILHGENGLSAVLSGGVLFGAVYMATDYVTTPTTHTGQIIFGIGCGVITAVIRLWGGYPEGVTYAILLMNVLTPLIDKFSVPRAFGVQKH